MGELEVRLRGKSLADYTNTQLRMALGAVLYTNTADMWDKYLKSLGYSGSVSAMLQKYYVDYAIPSQFRNYINAGAAINNPQNLFVDGSKGYIYDNNDYVNPTTWRRNLLTYSEQFDNAVWLKTTTSVTPNADGASDLLVPNAGSRTFSCVGQLSKNKSGPFTASARVKPAGYNFVSFVIANSVGRCVFDLSANTFTSYGGTGASGSVVNDTDGYKRITFSLTDATGGGEGELFISPRSSNADPVTSWTADGTSGIYVSWAQTEYSSTATTYQRITDFNSDFLAAYPNTTLFVDSAGTQPATVNGLVGLQLDKSAGLALGAEVIPQPLDLTTSWATQGTLSAIVADGFTNTSGSAAGRSLNITTGRWYRVSVTYTKSDSSTLFGVYGSALSASAIQTSTAASGTLTGTYLATGPVYLRLADNASVTITSMSLKEVSGNHRYQTTTGNKPILRGTPVGGNIVTNGDFASGTGWTAGAGWAIGSGVATATASSGILLSNDVATAGKVYRITFTVTSYTAGSLQIRMGGASAGFFSQTGTAVRYVTASTVTGLEFVSTGLTATIDNVEIHDVSAGQVQAPYALQFDGVDDFLQTASVDFATVTSDGLARRNLLTFPSAFDDAAWTSAAVGSVAVANQVAAPDGALTADLLRENTSTSNHYNSQSPTVTNTAHTFSVYYKIASGTRKLALYHAGTNVGRQFDAAGVISAGVFNTPAGGFGVEAIGNGWYRAWITTTPAAGSSAWRLWLVTSADALSYTGDGASGFYVWGAQLETGSTASTFQNIGTDKMTVCHGVRKLSDASDQGTVAELGANSAAVAGFALQTSPTLSARYRAQLYGTSRAVRDTSPVFAAPDTAVIAISFDIAGATVAEEIIGRRNGSVAFSENTLSPAGTGNFPSAVLYFGRRGGASFPYNGLDFGGVCIGKALTATQLASVEKWVARRTGVTI